MTDSYRQLREDAAWCDVSDRTRLLVRGKDRLSFLHNLTTNDIKRLTPGSGCETFLTNVQGKTVGYLHLYCGEEELLLETSAGQADALLAHLDRYLIREDVQLEDAGAALAAVLLVGPRSEVLLRQAAGSLPATPLAHDAVLLGDQPCRLYRSPLAGSSSWLITTEMPRRTALIGWLEQQEVAAGTPGDVETARIEAGQPLYGVDIDARTLPQEVDRNAQAISFTKGCYLGQETIARLDALGHVNRTLCGLRLSSAEVPAAGTELKLDGQVVARVTSATFSPTLSAPLALAYVRRGWNEVGKILATDLGEAEVVALPVA